MIGSVCVHLSEPTLQKGSNCMTFEDFDKVVANRLAQIETLMGGKREEYARRGDRLHNFKRAAALAQNTPEEALAGMWIKHIVSIFDMIDDIKEGKISNDIKLWEGKWNDNIVYTFLLEALVRERLETERLKIFGPEQRSSLADLYMPEKCDKGGFTQQTEF